MAQEDSDRLLSLLHSAKGPSLHRHRKPSSNKENISKSKGTFHAQPRAHNSSIDLNHLLYLQETTLYCHPVNSCNYSKLQTPLYSANPTVLSPPPLPPPPTTTTEPTAPTYSSASPSLLPPIHLPTAIPTQSRP